MVQKTKSHANHAMANTPGPYNTDESNEMPSCSIPNLTCGSVTRCHHCPMMPYQPPHQLVTHLRMSLAARSRSVVTLCGLQHTEGAKIGFSRSPPIRAARAAGGGGETTAPAADAGGFASGAPSSAPSFPSSSIGAAALSLPSSPSAATGAAASSPFFSSAAVPPPPSFLTATGSFPSGAGASSKSPYVPDVER